jgi:molybdopterin converting factor small subunit
MSIVVDALLFARYAELLGTDRIGVTLPDRSSAGDLLGLVRQRQGGDALPPAVLVAVNGRQATLDAPLRHGDEVALLPPLAGG